MNRPDSDIEPASRALWVYETTTEWFSFFGVTSTSERVGQLDNLLCSLYDHCIRQGLSAVELQQVPVRTRAVMASHTDRMVSACWAMRLGGL